MINFDAELLSTEMILKYVTPLQIFEKYMPIKFILGRPFNSPFRSDSRPSAVIVNGDRETYYRDFATKENYDCFRFVMKINYCTFRTCLEIIVRDFEIRNIEVSDVSSKRIMLDSDSYIFDNSDTINFPIYRKKVIEVVRRSFNSQDQRYWLQYGIELEDLVNYNVCAAKEVYMDGKLLAFCTKKEPIYAYKFENEGRISYKIYRPFNEKKYKWIFNGYASDIEGYDMLPWLGDILIITKSLKDVMCLYKLGIPAISLQGEANKIEVEFLDRLRRRFDRILIFYDNDKTGIQYASKASTKHGLEKIFISEEYGVKDISDFIARYSIDNAKELVNSMIYGDM